MIVKTLVYSSMSWSADALTTFTFKLIIIESYDLLKKYKISWTKTGDEVLWFVACNSHWDIPIILINILKTNVIFSSTIRYAQHQARINSNLIFHFLIIQKLKNVCGPSNSHMEQPIQVRWEIALPSLHSKTK